MSVDDEYTPTDEIVKSDWVRAQSGHREWREGSVARWGKEFDRWIAGRDLRAKRYLADALVSDEATMGAVDLLREAGHDIGGVAWRAALQAAVDAVTKEARNG